MRALSTVAPLSEYNGGLIHKHFSGFVELTANYLCCGEESGHEGRPY